MAMEATAQVRYRGPLRRVAVPLPSGRRLVVRRGETARVPATLAQALTRQADWEAVTAEADEQTAPAAQAGGDDAPAARGTRRRAKEG